ncbi:hypothetical protein VTO73DRAFT_7953 [Trametes versicolor]
MGYTICASYDGRPVSALLDPTALSSVVSSQFALTSNIARTISFTNGTTSLYACGPIRIPTPSGWYNSRFQMEIAYVRDHDVVLGGDWFRATAASLGSGFVNDPDPGMSLPITGHTWESSPFALRDCRAADVSGSAADPSAFSSDDGSKASSSRGLGSMNVASANAEHNIAYAVSVISPVIAGQGIFDPEAQPLLVQTVCTSHGVPVAELPIMQRALLVHMLSGVHMPTRLP